jgi:transposase
MDTLIFVGIDVAKENLDIAIRPNGESWTINNEEQSTMELAKRLKEMQPEVVVMEATGGYEKAVASVLVTSGLPVADAPIKKTYITTIEWVSNRNSGL